MMYVTCPLSTARQLRERAHIGLPPNAKRFHLPALTWQAQPLLKKQRGMFWKALIFMAKLCPRCFVSPMVLLCLNMFRGRRSILMQRVRDKRESGFQNKIDQALVSPILQHPSCGLQSRTHVGRDRLSVRDQFNDPRPAARENGCFRNDNAGEVHDKCWLHQMLFLSNHWAHFTFLDSPLPLFPSEVDIEERRNGALGCHSQRTR